MIEVAGTVAFEGIGWLAIALVIAAHFLGYFIRGAFGFGSNMPIVLLTTWVLGPHHAILLVALTSGLAQVHLLPQGFRRTDWPIVRGLAVGLVAGIGLGVWVFAELHADWLVLVLGLLIVVILLLDRFRVIERLRGEIDLRSVSVTGILAGISGLVGTISGGGGLYFLVVYLKLVCADPAALRSTNVFLSGTFMLVRIAFLGVAGLFTPELLLEAVLISPIVFVASWSGTRLFHRTPPDRFYLGLQVVLLAAAMALFVRGLLYLV